MHSKKAQACFITIQQLPPIQALCILLLATTIIASPALGSATTNGKCKYCSLIVETFKAGMKKTENQHFAGGNTDWEERKLGKFAKSETRLVEIMEHLCRTKYLDNSDQFRNVKDLEFKCQQLVEEHEESIENWYFHKQLSNPDFYKWLCHEKLRLCCDAGHYGVDCKPCPGVDKDLPACSGHGTCQGDGTREGSGKCRCHKGYVGFMCSNCDANYYAARNGSAFTCNECHVACRVGCSGGGPENCKECRSGWIMNERHECTDVNECLDENRCAGDHKKCRNTEGSYECICDEGYVLDSNDACVIDVKAVPEQLWVRPDKLLRSFSIAALCILVTVVIWRRSFANNTNSDKAENADNETEIFKSQEDTMESKLETEEKNGQDPASSSDHISRANEL